MTYEDSNNGYREYVKEHISNVKKVWGVFEGILNTIYADNIQLLEIEQQIQAHDASKYSMLEFTAYRQKFFTADEEEKNDARFHAAWVHHIANNPHHWEYWVSFKNGKPYPCEMSLSSVVEMLCDWTAMSVKFNNVPSDWFEENRTNIILHENTLTLVMSMLSYFDDIYTDLKEG